MSNITHFFPIKIKPANNEVFHFPIPFSICNWAVIYKADFALASQPDPLRLVISHHSYTNTDMTQHESFLPTNLSQAIKQGGIIKTNQLHVNFH